MNTSDFLAEIDRNAVRLDAFSLLELKDETYCLQTEDSRRTTFYFERGERVSPRSFDTHSAALEALLQTLLSDPTTRQ